MTGPLSWGERLYRVDRSRTPVAGDFRECSFSLASSSANFGSSRSFRGLVVSRFILLSGPGGVTKYEEASSCCTFSRYSATLLLVTDSVCTAGASTMNMSEDKLSSGLSGESAITSSVDSEWGYCPDSTVSELENDSLSFIFLHSVSSEFTDRSRHSSSSAFASADEFRISMTNPG